MRAHLLGVSYCPCDPELYPYCSYSTLLRSTALALSHFGVSMSAYVAEGSPEVSGCDQTHECVSLETIKKAHPDFPSGSNLIDRNQWTVACEEFCSRAKELIRETASPGDVVVAFHGGNHRPAIPTEANLVVVEMPGHSGHWAPYCCFPSMAFWHHEIAAGRRRLLHYDGCVPHPVPDPGPAPRLVSECPARPYLLFIGRLVPEKGHGVAEDVSRAVGIPLVTVGQYSGSPKGMGVVGQAERNRLMAGATCLLMPSQTCEPFGLVAAEANALGCQVVTTPWGGPPEIIGRSGGFVCHTIGEMVDAVRECMRDPERYRLQARRRYLKTCSPPVVGYRLLRWMMRARELTMGRSHFYSVDSPRVAVRALCINLERRPDRRAFMREVCSTEGIDVSFVTAVDQESVNCPWEDSRVLGNARQKYACSMSHLRAWREALAVEGDRVMILEDDVFFAPGWHGLVESAGPVDLIMLNSTSAHPQPEGWSRAQGCVLAGAYILTKRALLMLLDRFQTEPDVADMMLCWLQDRVDATSHFPCPAMQMIGVSDIQVPSHQERMNCWAGDTIKAHRRFYFDFGLSK